MREFVYLSERKLTQFVPGRRRFWRRFGLQKVSAKALGVEATLDLGAAPTTSYQSLEKVVSHLEVDARWYGDPSVRTGTWVYFDSLLYQTAVWLGETATSAAIFLDVDPAVGTPPARRLFLHGSAEHLVGTTPSDRPTPADAGPRTPGSVSTGLTRQMWGDLAHGLGYRSETATTLPGATAVVDVRALKDALGWVFSTVTGDEFHQGQAAWMAGCARVTSMVDLEGSQVLTASPLYVERVAPPD